MSELLELTLVSEECVRGDSGASLVPTDTRLAKRCWCN